MSGHQQTSTCIQPQAGEHATDLEVNNALLVLQKAGVIDGRTHTGMSVYKRRRQVLATHREKAYDIINMCLILNALSIATNSDDDLHGICRFLSHLRASVNMVRATEHPPTKETQTDSALVDESTAAFHGNAARMTPRQINEDEWDVANMHVAQTLAWHTGHLADLWNSANATANESGTVDDNLSVVEGIERLRSTISEKRACIAAVNLLIQKTRWKAVKVLEDALRRSLRITEEDTRERAGASGESERADVGESSSVDSHVRLQIARGRAIGSKMEMIRAEMAALTYTADSVRALKRLSATISQRVAQVSQQLESRSELLAQYEGLDFAQFATIASRYSQLKTQLEQSLWNLRQLGLGLN